MIRRLTVALGLIAALALPQAASAHNYWSTNWATCTYDYYEEVSRWSGSHTHRYVYSRPMPSNYCTG